MGATERGYDGRNEFCLPITVIDRAAITIDHIVSFVTGSACSREESGVRPQLTGHFFGPLKPHAVRDLGCEVNEEDGWSATDEAKP